jgi:phosphohistidine phosphatase
MWASLETMPKTLYLLRHAKASRDDPAVGDVDRPLAPRGRRDARKMAERLGADGIAPDVVLCSPSVRTRETLKLIHSGFAADVRIVIEPGIYAASCGEVLAILRTVGEDVGSAMLIGHNPAIQDLALSLATTGKSLDQVRRKFPTGALATLTFACGWRELSPTVARLVAFVAPQDLR